MPAATAAAAAAAASHRSWSGGGTTRRCCVELLLVQRATMPAVTGVEVVRANFRNLPFFTAAIALLLAVPVQTSQQLLEAAATGDLETVQWELSWGLTKSRADPNFIGSKKEGSNAPLHLAKTASIVSALVDAGAVLDIRDENGWTPLHVATSTGNLDVTQALVRAGANVNEAVEALPSGSLPGKAEGGAMALHMATWRENAEMITVLLEAGADIEAQLQDGRRPLHIACSDDSVLADQTLGDSDAAVLTLIQAGAQLEVSDVAGKRPLHWAAQSGVAKSVAYLIEAGADVDAPTAKTGLRALHLAAKNGHTTAAAVAIAAGADLNAPASNTWTALHFAAANGHSSVVAVLIGERENIELNARNRQGWTPLHLAIAQR